MRRHIIVLGMPGAGKDTQCDMLAKALGAVIVKTGDIARELAKTNTDIARVLQKGGLVDDDIINTKLAEKLQEIPAESDILFDGFPRRVEQAQWLDSQLGENEAQNLHVYYLKISQDSALKRLLQRGRGDDTESIIRNRLRVFADQTEPVLGYYRSGDRLVEIDGEPSPDIIQSELQRKIKEQ
jgi:adenylate kinase